MKVKIELRICYDDPGSEDDYKKIMEEIKNYFENDIIIPQTENVFWNIVLPIQITDDYKSPEKE